jgi:hypothetical protein
VYPLNHPASHASAKITEKIQSMVLTPTVIIGCAFYTSVERMSRVA